LTVTALATATIAAGTLIPAAPAHADRAQDCEVPLTAAQVDFRMYEWYGVAFGTNSPQAQGYLKSSIAALDFWMVNC
jgi:hypothetical protein